jgi:hypothetical protein
MRATVLVGTSSPSRSKPLLINLLNRNIQMKYSILLAALLAFSLTACGKKEEAAPAPEAAAPAAEVAAPAPAAPADMAAPAADAAAPAAAPADAAAPAAPAAH